MRSHLVAAAALLLAVASPPRLMAQVRAGEEFRVNTFTTGSQHLPAIAADAVGNFVIVWGCYQQGLVVGQRLDPTGAPRTPEFAIASGGWPSVAPDAIGGFTAAWHDGQILARRYDSLGFPYGPAFQVNTYTTSTRFTASVAHDASGNSIVVWTSYGQDGSLEGIFGRSFDASGAPKSPEFQVNAFTTGQQRFPRVASDAAGRFVVVWQRGAGAWARRFGADGVPRGPEFQVATYSGGYVPSRPAVASDLAGNFVVAWQSKWQEDPWGAGISAQRYDANGSPVGPQFHVNTYTGGSQYSPAVAADPAGNFVVVWHGENLAEDNVGIFGQRYDSTGAPRGGEFRISTYTSGSQSQPAVALDGAGNTLVAWTSGWQDAGTAGIYAQRLGGLLPAAMRVDPYPSGYSDGNEVLEQNEAVGVWSWWRNVNGASQAFDGQGLSFTGPVTDAVYVLGDASGAYGTVANGATAACSDCYALGVSSGMRPAVHWDATFTERLTPDVHGQTKLWSIHVGESFVDVPRTSPYYRLVETLLHKGVTGGCSVDSYCPVEAVTREQLAVFVLAGKEGKGYLPQACGTTPVFADVPASSPFCRFVEDLTRRGVVGGCGGGNYCPSSAVTREQMPVFVLKTLDPYIDPPACGTPMFGDVPATSPYCKFIEELARRGVVGGCGGGNYCPADPVTREQMAVFISATFGLTLYGP